MTMNMSFAPYPQRLEPAQPKAKIFTRRKQGQATNGRLPGKNPLVIDLDCLSRFFGVSQKQACEVLGIGLSTMKRMCRKLGIKAWPGPGSSCKSPVPSPCPPPHQIAYHHMAYPMPPQYAMPVPHPAYMAPVKFVAQSPKQQQQMHEVSQVWIRQDAEKQPSTSKACELELFGFTLPNEAAPQLPDFMTELNQHKNAEESEQTNRPDVESSCCSSEEEEEEEQELCFAEQQQHTRLTVDDALKLLSERRQSLSGGDEFLRMPSSSSADFARLPSERRPSLIAIAASSSSSSAPSSSSSSSSEDALSGLPSQRRSSLACGIDNFLFEQNQRGLEADEIFASAPAALLLGASSAADFW